MAGSRVAVGGMGVEIGVPGSGVGGIVVAVPVAVAVGKGVEVGGGVGGSAVGAGVGSGSGPVRHADNNSDVPSNLMKLRRSILMR